MCIWHTNKWRIFHRAIDVYPVFCDVIVKTCCILHNFVRQRRFLVSEYFIQLSPREYEGVGTRVTDMGRWAQVTARWEAWQRARLPGTWCGRRLWGRAPPSIATPLWRMGGGGVRTPRTRKELEGGLCKRSTSLSMGAVWGEPREKGPSLLGILKVM
jgi:hypothetical protein